MMLLINSQSLAVAKYPGRVLGYKSKYKTNSCFIEWFVEYRTVYFGVFPEDIVLEYESKKFWKVLKSYVDPGLRENKINIDL